METLHQRVPVGVDRQHRERQQLIGRPAFPYAGDGYRAAVSALDAPAHRLVGFVLGLEGIGDRDDAKLLALPGAAEGGFAGHRLGTGIVGLAGLLVVGPVGHHAEHGRSNLHLARRFVRTTEDRRHVAWPCVGWEVEQRISGSKTFLELHSTAWSVVGAHLSVN